MNASLKTLKDLVRSGEYINRVFLAGGAVRDMEMGVEPKDLDVVVTGDLNSGMDFAVWATKKLGNYKEGSNPVVFPTFGTARFVLLDGSEIESVATRKEKYTSGSRKPVVSLGVLKEDVFRRDFCANSLLLDLTTDEVLDLTGMGREDIRIGIIRTTSEPDVIFEEDPLRMLRAVRFSAKYGWNIELNTARSIHKQAEKIKNISFERIRDEINKMLMTDNPDAAIYVLRGFGLFDYFAPEISAMIHVEQNKFHSKDVFYHTMDVLAATPKNLECRLMALFHDIGKPKTKSIDENGVVHFYGHEDVGADITREVMARLKYSNEMISSVVCGVRNHMRLKHGGDNCQTLSDKSLRKFRNLVGANIENVLDLIHADNCAHSEEAAMPNQIKRVREGLLALDDEPIKPNLPINGDDLIELGFKPGKIFKDLLSKVEEAWFENPNLTRSRAIDIVKGYI